MSPRPSVVRSPFSSSAADTAAAHQAISAMVGPGVHVTVQIDPLLVEHRVPAPLRTVTPAAALVCVELDGPDASYRQPEKRIVAKRAAPAWCSDEIISAARRAAERIIGQHPAWRCGSAVSQPV